MATHGAGKWIRGIRPEEPVSRAAELALQSRLGKLWRLLPKAACEAEDDIEYVHQTRVAARRAMTALETFSELLPKRRGRKLRKTVHRVRKAAGDARDDDVLLLRWQTWLEQHPEVKSGSTMLHELRQQRAAHQRPIESIYQHLIKKDFPRQVNQILHRVRWRAKGPEPSFLASAEEAFATFLSELRSALTGDWHSPQRLHELRILGKRIRYALELFAGAYSGVNLRSELYGMVSHGQELLGQVNDHATAVLRLENWPAEDDAAPPLARDLLLDLECAALEQSRAAFITWWETGQGKLLASELKRLKQG